jgi:hypothetical protein
MIKPVNETQTRRDSAFVDQERICAVFLLLAQD